MSLLRRAWLPLTLCAVVAFVSLSPRGAEGRRRLGRITRAAEWGVWKVHEGEVTSLDELAAELPPFVHHGASSAPPPHIVHHPVTVRKPVLYLYSGESSFVPRVRVSVGLPRPQQGLHFPRAQTERNRLEFSGRLFPLDNRGRRRAHAALPRVARSHFWHDMRQVPASVFEVGDEAERFIFYDGYVEMRSPFVFYGAGEHATVGTRPGREPTANLEDAVYWVHGGRYRKVVVGQGSPVELSGAGARPVARLEAELRTQLRARGLSDPEATSLLATWRHDLVEARGDRRIYFIDRADYDAMLPITIFPRPAQLVRVGLVIDEP